MTESEFRVIHSELIGYYQLIEMRLKYICADLLADKEKNWYKSLYDYGSDPLGLLIQKTKELQEKTQTTVLTQNDFESLDDLRKTRNYWVHQCFQHIGNDHQVVFKKGELKKSEYAKKIRFDLNIAIEWDEKLTIIGSSVTKKKNYKKELIMFK